MTKDEKTFNDYNEEEDYKDEEEDYGEIVFRGMTQKQLDKARKDREENFDYSVRLPEDYEEEEEDTLSTTAYSVEDRDHGLVMLKVVVNGEDVGTGDYIVFSSRKAYNHFINAVKNNDVIE